MRRFKWFNIPAAFVALSCAGSAANGIEASFTAVQYAGSAPIVVDGDLSDWDAVSTNPLALTQQCPRLAAGAKPLQAGFRGLVDRDYLYIAIAGQNDGSAARGLAMARLVDIQFYGDTSVRSLRYQKFRGIDGSIDISYAQDGRTVLGGAVRLPSEGEPGTLLECPNLWELLGARVGLKRTKMGFTAEVAIPIEALGWQPGSPSGQLRLNVRVFGFDAEGARTALQWAADPLNTSETSHELLGTITFAPPTSGQPAKPKDHAARDFFAVLHQLASGHAAEALPALIGASDPRTLPLLGIAYRSAGEPEAARTVFQQLTSAKTPEPLRTWATTQLPAPDTVAAQSSSELDRLITEGTRFSVAGRWADAAGVFRKITETKTTPVKHRVWAMLQIQEGQLSAGANEDSTATGWEIQRTAPDGDPNRRESLDRIMAVYFSNTEGLKRANRAALERRQPEPLYAAYLTQLRARDDGIGCWQELELGELMRVEAATRLAIDHYRAASEMPTCPRADRAWALLLLQRAQAEQGQTAAAISVALRINADYADEWDVRSASLSEASVLPGTQAETLALRRARAEFRTSLTESPLNTSADSRHALSVLGELDRSLRSGENKEAR